MEWFKKHKWLSVGGGVLIVLWLTGSFASPASSTSQPTPQPVVEAAQEAAVSNDSVQLPSSNQQTQAAVETAPTVRVQPQPDVSAPEQTVPNLSNDNTYTNVDGNTIHSPAYTSDDSVPTGASAQCRDGSYSFSQNRRGTCSHHGGVARWL